MTLQITIIGGVAGGAGAAAAARRANEAASIDLFEAGPYISFANCGLPYYLSGEIETREKLLVTTPDQMRERFNIAVHVRHAVLSIDRVRRMVRVKDLETSREFDHAYDRLVLATGAKGIRPPAPGLDHFRVVACRTVDDIDRIVKLAKAGGRALVIGGGFIGIEVAEAMVKRGLSVHVVDLARQILPPLDPEIAKAGQKALQRRGVVLDLGVKMDTMVHDEKESHAILSDGREIAFDVAVLAIGVTPETSLAHAAGLEIGSTGGIVVDQYQRTSDAAIFAAGDVTELLFWPTQRRTKLALAGPANKQARAAGWNAASPTPQMTTSGAAGTSIVRVFELALGMTGLSEKAAAAMKIPYRVVYTQNGHHAGYFPGVRPLFIKLLFSPAEGRLLGGQIFGEQGVDKRLDVLATAIQAGFTVDQLAELDLAYAPPFGAAKDPLIIAGMVGSNIVHGRSKTITPRELAEELAGPNPPLVVDVRTDKEHALGRIDGAVNLPLESLRQAHGQLDKNRAIVVHCAVGYRGYLAERLLRQQGFQNVRNLTGGWRAWELFQP